MAEAMATAAETPNPPAKSFLARVIGVIFSPGATFADIAQHPNFIAPLVLAIVASVAVTETMLAKIGMERIVRMSIERSGRTSSMSAAQMEQAVQQGARIGGIIAHVMGVLGPGIFLLILAGLGILILVPVFGAKANFKTVFSVSCYAYIPALLGALITIPVMLFGDPETFNPQTPMPSNPAFFMDQQTASKALYALASSVDIFTIWLLIVLSIGLSAASAYKVKTRSVFLVYLGLWALWVLAKVGWVALVG